ncbi:Lysophospholipid acyltransferase [Astathelohania contejeani]|uniref:Lysophospholipid acyltransferase n=1 Tax=Astathelohania contejeani TaxID=164912 RepID=A0ABQ7HVR4_9MICR|nr:Lysophospholipid acyltransferase [Thelohania contejeani]
MDFSIGYAEKTYAIGLLSTLITSILFKKEIFHIISSIFIIIYVYGIYSTILFFASIFINYTLLLIFQSSNILVLYNFTTLTVYNILEYSKNITTGFNITVPIMLLTIKMYYLGKEYKSPNIKINNFLRSIFRLAKQKEDIVYDKKESKHEKKNVVHGIKDFWGYLLHTPGLLIGPSPSFLFYLKHRFSTPNYRKGLLILLESFFYLSIHRIFENVFSKKLLLIRHAFYKQIIFIILYGIGQRSRYYFAWTFSRACYLFAGMDVINIYPFQVETSTTIRDLKDSWNVYTNAWLKDCFYLSLNGSRFVRSLYTFFASALWHGVRPAYFLMFFSFAICSPLLRSNNRVIRSWVLRWIQMVLWLSYIEIPFLVVNLADTIRIWRNVYFYGNVYMLLSIIYYLKTKKSKQML